MKEVVPSIVKISVTARDWIRRFARRVSIVGKQKIGEWLIMLSMVQRVLGKILRVGYYPRSIRGDIRAMQRHDEKSGKSGTIENRRKREAAKTVNQGVKGPKYLSYQIDHKAWSLVVEQGSKIFEAIQSSLELWAWTSWMHSDTALISKLNVRCTM